MQRRETYLGERVINQLNEKFYLNKYCNQDPSSHAADLAGLNAGGEAKVKANEEQTQAR